MYNITKDIEKRWEGVMEHADLPKIEDSHRKNVTLALIENQFQENKKNGKYVSEAVGGDDNAVANAAVQNWNPVLISLVRRAMPNNIGFDIAGVQPMNGPTSLIFAMKAQHNNTVGGVTTQTEALFNKPNTAFSGKYSTAEAEALEGSHDGDVASPSYTGNETGFKKMGFTIDKTTVTAKSRALRADYTIELAQDLQAIHGLSAESELASILSTEILAEMNQEVIDVTNAKAKPGAENAASTGTFDLLTDADGRWAVERFKSLQFQIELEANKIALETRRGRGNWIICSSNVASALSAAGVLNSSSATGGLSVDPTQSTFAGTIGTMKVYVDPYAVADYATVGYRGTNPYDAGLFYCPYVPLSMMKATGEDDFQPRIGFKTRYGIVTNPFVANNTANDGVGNDNENPYFRTFAVTNINVGA